MAYPVFKESLEEASEYIHRLGSPWFLIGKAHLFEKRDD
jgi:hypothetical protein